MTLQFVQAGLSDSFFDWDIPDACCVPLNTTVAVSVTGGSGAQVYLLITDPDDTFYLDQPPSFYFDGSYYQVEMKLKQALPVGQHFGTLHAALCSDVACNSVLTSDTLPYSINVKANPTLTFTSPTTLVGKALVTGASDPDVVGFKIPTLVFLGLAQVPVEFRSPIYIQSHDADGRIVVRGIPNTDYFYLQEASSTPFPMDFTVVQLPAAGEYAGAITFDVCRDPGCTMRFSGTSTVPYQLSVANTNLTALAPVAGAPEWQNAYGNPAHSSYTPLTVDQAALAPRWLSKAAQGTEHNFSSDIVTSAGRVFVTREGEYLSASTDLYALNESDGSVAWQKNFAGGTKSSLLAANGNVYLRTAVYNDDATLRAYDAGTGAETFAVATGSHYASAPVNALGSDLLIADTVDGPNGYQPQFNRYDGQTGALIGAPPCLQPIEWQPMNNNGYHMRQAPPTLGEKAYISMSSGLEVVDFGAAPSCTSWAYGDLWTHTGDSALAPSGNLLYAQHFCTSFSPLLDVSTTSYFINWAQDSDYCGVHAPAIAGGVVYRVWGGGLEARNEATGALLWRLKPFNFDMNGAKLVVTDNTVFVKKDRTYAIDIATHRIVWTLTPTNGPVAVSPSGLLYVLDRAESQTAPDWRLIAVNVR